MITKFYLPGNNLIHTVLFCLQYLSNEDYEGKKSEEIGKLEQTILTQLKVKHTGVFDEQEIQILEIQKSFLSVFLISFIWLPDTFCNCNQKPKVGIILINILPNFLQHHEKNVREKKRIMKDLGKTVKSRDSENSSMDNDLAELNVTVNERRHIDEVNGKFVWKTSHVLQTFY